MATMDPSHPLFQQGQAALMMMTPEQRKKAVAEAMAKATPEEKKQVQQQQLEMQKQLEKATPEQRQQMAQQQQIMMNVGTFCQHLAPTSAEPEKEHSTVEVLAAMSECQSFDALTEAIKMAPAETQKAVVMAFIKMERALLDSMNEADATSLRENKSKPEKRRALLLLLWCIYQHKVGEAYALDESMFHYYVSTKRLATTLLMHAQPLVARQRWVNPTLAVCRVSALLVNELWSHSDPDAITRMKAILEPDGPGTGMPYPELSLKARVVHSVAAESGTEGVLDETSPTPDSTPTTCIPGSILAVQVALIRGHAGRGKVTDDIADAAANPHGILEAYWLYIEGHTPDGAPNLLHAAQPLSCTTLGTASLPASIKFEAPTAAGEYKVSLHVSSTSVVGCDLQMDLSFIVQEDDVPALE